MVTKMIRRAPKACQVCRHKKIRCDVSTRGVPCANCSSAQTQCSVRYARKEKRRTKAEYCQDPSANTRVFDFQINEATREDVGNHRQSRVLGEGSDKNLRIKAVAASIDASFVPVAQALDLKPSYSMPSSTRSFCPSKSTAGWLTRARCRQEPSIGVQRECTRCITSRT